jgi:hypothetical protein
VKAQRIVTFEEFMSQPRSPLDVAAYHGCLAALKRMGMVADDLTIIGPRPANPAGELLDASKAQGPVNG